jgi:hypothetical protein
VVHAAALENRPHSNDDPTRIFSVAATGSTEVATVPGAFGTTFGLAAAYLVDSRRLLSVDLADGRLHRLARVSYVGESLAESPDGRWLAYHDGERLRLRELATGSEHRVAVRSGGPIAWLSNDRLLYRRGGEGRVYDTGLELRRRYPFFRLHPAAYVSGRLFGMARFELRVLGLASGRRRLLARLPDRGIVALAGVPGSLAVDLDPAAPGLGFGSAARRASTCRPGVRG